MLGASGADVERGVADKTRRANFKYDEQLGVGSGGAETKSICPHPLDQKPTRFGIEVGRVA